MMPKSISPSPRQEPFTMVPNAFFDVVMREISGAELAVTLVVIRQTTGYQKYEDTISLTQFEKLGNLSRSGVIDGLEKALERGYVSRRASKRYNGRQHLYKFTPPKLMSVPLKVVEKKSTVEQLKEKW